jgi:tRNA A-37 threonylcarbamoyl transferase component Bud32
VGVSSGAPFSAGQVLAGRYKLEQPLGRGGMGSVWRATHTITRRSVALKVLQQSLELRQDMRQRLLREARAAASVGHPCVVEVIDVLELPDGAPMLVMEYLEGETLGALLQREGALELERALSLLLPVVAAVGTAHLRGIVHRDLKPDNVFLRKSALGLAPKVLDFGIAKLLGDELMGDQALLTGTGVVLGTPCYMAPEQSFGERGVDARADIWSLGAIFYEALSGGRPVEGENLGQVIRSLLTQGITPLSALAPELPDDVSGLVMRMLAKEPADRPAELGEVYEALQRHHAGASSWPGILTEPPLRTSPSDTMAAQALATTSVALPPAPPAPDTAALGAQTVSIVRAPRKPWLAVGVSGVALAAGAALAWRLTALGAATSAPPIPSPKPLAVAAAVPVEVVEPAPPVVELQQPSTAPSRAIVAVAGGTRSRPPIAAATASPDVAVAAPPPPTVAAPERPSSPAPREGLEEEPPF